MVAYKKHAISSERDIRKDKIRYSGGRRTPVFNYDVNGSWQKWTVWLGLCGSGQVIGPFFFGGSVNGENYLRMINKDVIWQLLKHLELQVEGAFGHLCLCLFVMSFIYMNEELLSPSILLFISAIVTSMSYCIYLLTGWDHRTKNVQNDVKSLILFLMFSFGLSPILRTLTDSISTDTIYAMTAFMLGMNLLMHDYGASGAVVSKAASLNTAIFGSVCLASRLPSSWHAFVTVIMAVEIFALFPVFREQIKIFFPGSQSIMTWGLLIIALVSVVTISFLAGIFFLLAQTAVIFVCPYWLVCLQRYKNNIHGPWDEAVIRTGFST